MISLKSKKGLGSVEFIAATVVILVLALLIILYINGFFGTLTQAQGILTPEILSIFTQRCKSVAIDANTYCAYEKVKLSKVTKEVLINCEFEDIQNALKQSNSDYTTTISCAGAIRDTLAERVCTDYPTSSIYKDGKIALNCKEVLARTKTCQENSGKWTIGSLCDLTKEEDITNNVIESDVNIHDNTDRCCKQKVA